uniref:Uncharacterized protein n=1 Tax=Haptolina brevifila TaxID=156173 RepID=A0A7S2BC89_9EUKA
MTHVLEAHLQRTKQFDWTAPIEWRQTTRATRPLPFLAFYGNIAGSIAAKERVVPILLQASDTVERAHAIGLNLSMHQPKLIWVNPLMRGVRHEMQLLWPLLACGGTMAGQGYHLPTVQSDVDAFAASTGATLEARVLHAPGATKYEKTLPFSHEILLDQKRSNFSYWAFRGKTCDSAASR